MAAAPDLAAFQEDSFDPKNWINAACDNKSSEESLERFARTVSPAIVRVKTDAAIHQDY